jgi:RES domain-containing protein
MSLKVWRLSKRRYAAEAFSGDGPRIFGGRWNPVDVPMVYTSLSLSLAVLEVFVHMPKAAEPDDYVAVMAELPVEASALERLDLKKLPSGWKKVESPVTQAMGAAWARSRRSLVLLVPSVVVPGEWNAVVNPLHSDAGKIRIVETTPFRFDARMFR